MINGVSQKMDIHDSILSEIFIMVAHNDRMIYYYNKPNNDGHFSQYSLRFQKPIHYNMIKQVLVERAT